MQKKIQKIFLVSEIIASELAVLTCLKILVTGSQCVNK